jgi:hypothetical protein
MLMVGIHTGYLISFIQIQPIQNHWWNFGKYDNLKNVNSFSTITGKKLMQPIKYKHVLMCYIYHKYINITICWNVCTSNTIQSNVNKFIAVKLSDGSFTFNKNSNFKLDLTITLPEILTQSI